MRVNTWGTVSARGCAAEGAALRRHGVRVEELSPHSPGPADDGSGDLSSALHGPEEGGDLSVRESLSGVFGNTRDGPTNASRIAEVQQRPRDSAHVYRRNSPGGLVNANPS